MPSGTLHQKIHYLAIKIDSSMLRKISLFILFSAIALTATAQFKVTSFESPFKSDCCYELKYILESESSTFIYGTFTSPKDDGKFAFNQNLAVIQNDLKYKVKNSIHMPVWDEAERMYVIMEEAGEKLNFVVEFEKFSPEKPFDIIETEKKNEGNTSFNLYGVITEATDYENIPDAGKFLDRYPVTIRGTYKDKGVNVQYINHDGVYVSCQSTWCEGGLFEPDYYRFLIEINNDSPRGIAFDFEKFYAVAKRTVRGKEEEKIMTKYTPDSFADYMSSQDYQEAKNAAGGGLSMIGNKLHTLSLDSHNDEWANIGLKMLSNLANEAAEHNIQEYLASHPKNRPDVLRSQSIASGEGISGYVAVEKKKNDSYVVHVPVDGYDFTFSWN